MKIRPVLLLLAAAIVLALPLFLYGPMVQGHDTLEHLNYSKFFTEQFWTGEGYPRWLAGINHGLGSPAFFVYGPLPFYVCALLEPAAKAFHFSGYDLAAFLALFGSGVSAFLWLNTIIGRRAATCGGVLYMLVPYHLAIDFYRRSALPECWGFVWMPLVLYFTAGVIARKRRAFVGLAIAYALLIFSHLFTVLMFSLVPLAAALVLSRRGKRIQSGLGVAVAMVLGAGLSSVYLLTALFHERYIPAAKLILLTDQYDWADNFLRFGRGLLVHSTGSNFARNISWLALSTIALTAICGAVALRNASPTLKKTLLFWLGVCAVTVFVMSKLSYPLWLLLPRLQDVQFPWRFNVVLCVAAVPVLAIFLSETSRMPCTSQTPLRVFVVLLLASWLIAYAVIWNRYFTETVLPNDELNLVVDHDELFPAWSPPNTDQASALRASGQPSVRFVTGVGSAQVLLWKPRHIEFLADSPTGGSVMINQFYYPAWEAHFSRQEKSIDIRAAAPEGLLELQVPAGLQHVSLEIPVGTAERLGRWISVFSALLCALMAWGNKDRGAALSN